MSLSYVRVCCAANLVHVDVRRFSKCSHTWRNLLVQRFHMALLEIARGGFE